MLCENPSCPYQEPVARAPRPHQRVYSFTDSPHGRRLDVNAQYAAMPSYGLN